MPIWKIFSNSKETELNHLKDDLHFYELRIIEDQHRIKMIKEKIDYIENSLIKDKQLTSN